MALEIRIALAQNGDIEVQAWNPPLGSENKVEWHNKLSVLVVVTWPYPDASKPKIFPIMPGKKSKPQLDLSDYRTGEYPYSVFVDDSKRKRRDFVHHSDPKIIIR